MSNTEIKDIKTLKPKMRKLKEDLKTLGITWSEQARIVGLGTNKKRLNSIYKVEVIDEEITGKLIALRDEKMQSICQIAQAI